MLRQKSLETRMDQNSAYYYSFNSCNKYDNLDSEDDNPFLFRIMISKHEDATKWLLRRLEYLAVYAKSPEVIELEYKNTMNIAEKIMPADIANIIFAYAHIVNPKSKKPVDEKEEDESENDNNYSRIDDADEYTAHPNIEAQMWFIDVLMPMFASKTRSRIYDKISKLFSDTDLEEILIFSKKQKIENMELLRFGNDLSKIGYKTDSLTKYRLDILLTIINSDYILVNRPDVVPSYADYSSDDEEENIIKYDVPNDLDTVSFTFESDNTNLVQQFCEAVNIENFWNKYLYPRLEKANHVGYGYPWYLMSSLANYNKTAVTFLVSKLSLISDNFAGTNDISKIIEFYIHIDYIRPNLFFHLPIEKIKQFVCNQMKNSCSSDMWSDKILPQCLDHICDSIDWSNSKWFIACIKLLCYHSKSHGYSKGLINKVMTAMRKSNNVEYKHLPFADQQNKFSQCVTVKNDVQVISRDGIKIAIPALEFRFYSELFKSKNRIVTTSDTKTLATFLQNIRKGHHDFEDLDCKSCIMYLELTYLIPNKCLTLTAFIPKLIGFINLENFEALYDVASKYKINSIIIELTDFQIKNRYQILDSYWNKDRSFDYLLCDLVYTY
jgi:hypothetical protein